MLRKGITVFEMQKYAGRAPYPFTSYPSPPCWSRILTDEILREQYSGLYGSLRQVSALYAACEAS